MKATKNKLRKASKRDTPEKPGTPNASQENLLDDDSIVEKKYVIINDEILALRIKHEDLQKLRDPKPPSAEKQSKTELNNPVVVRKLRPYSEWHKPATKTLVVARPAPPDARLRPKDCLETGGLRFDDTGDIIPHSILGSVDEYKKEAERQGELPLELYIQEEERSPADQLPVKYDKPPPRIPHPRMESTDMTNALKNWTQKMRDRKRQQGYLSKLLNKPPCQLTMNQGQKFREVEETRYLINRTLHTIDYGKGYRTGSEFWTQPEPLGDELSGIHLTVTQTLRGYPPPVEHVGLPKIAKQEAGIYCPNTPDTNPKPWHTGIFLHRRLHQLGGVIKELDPHWPNIHTLQVQGHAPEAAASTEEVDSRAATAEAASHVTAERESYESEDPLRHYPDVHPLPVTGPSLIFDGQLARWTLSASLGKSATVGIEARIAFEAYATKRVTSYLEIVNDGTTAIYFDWVKVPKTNPFEVMTSRVQRFYFNTTSGVILPGDVLKFPFVFKSPNAGVFSEQWYFQTKPTLNTGSPLAVTLRGVALQEDKYAKQRTALEQMLFHRQAEQIATTILSDLLEGIRTPERARSPIDSYITEEEIFLRKNPYLHYDQRLVTRLKELYIDTMTHINPDVECTLDDWDLDIAGLKQMILGIMEDEEDDKKQELLGKLSTREVALCFSPFTPTQQRMQSTCYDLLCDAVDNMVGYSMLLRTTLGMAERLDEGLPEDPDSDEGNILGEVPEVCEVLRVNIKSRLITADAKKTPAPSSKAKPDAKEKKSGKEGKGGRSSKEGKELGSKGSKTPVSGNKRLKDSTSTDSQPSKITVASAGNISAAFLEKVNPITEAKYKEKLNTQAYQLLLHMADKMATAFEAIDIQASDPTYAF